MAHAKGTSDIRWTMLAYLAGDNNLTEEMVWALQQMRATLASGHTSDGARIADRVEVVARFDARGLSPRTYFLDGGVGPGARDGHLDRVASKEELDELPSAVEPGPEQIAVARIHMRPKLRQCERELAKLLEQPCEALLTAVVTKAVELERAGTTNRKKKVEDCLAELIWRMKPELEEGHCRTLAERVAEEAAKASSAAERGLAGRMAHAPGAVASMMEARSCERWAARQAGEKTAGTLALILSGHGGGAMGGFLTDNDPHGAVSVPGLGRIVAAACRQRQTATGESTRKIGILGLDSCLMSMAEVCCEVWKRADCLVGSEGFTANTGWPYQRVLEVLADQDRPEAAARAIARCYTAFYRDYELGGCSTQIAAIDLDSFGTRLLPAVKGLVGRLREELTNVGAEGYWGPRTAGGAGHLLDAILLAHWNAQTFRMGQYVDLWDFCAQLRRLTEAEGSFGEVRDRLDALLKAIEGEDRPAVSASYYCGPDFQNAHGLSVYFPWSREELEPAYQNLEFDRVTGWYGLLQLVLEHTQRRRRGQQVVDSQKLRREPYRFGSDSQALLERLGLNEPRRMGLAAAARAGFTGDARSGFTGDARSGFTGDSRSGFTGDARMAGKAVEVNFQNPPDGYFRQNLGDDVELDKESREFYGKE